MRPFAEVFLPEGVFGHDFLRVGEDFVEFAVAAGLGFAVIDLDAVVEIELNLVQGQVAEPGIVVLTFLDLLLHLFQAFFGYRYFMGRMTVVDDILHAIDFVAVNLFHAVKIIGADAASCVLVTAMEIDQAFEAVLFATVIEPVNRPVLVGFAVVLEEIFEEIRADDVTARFASGTQVIGDKGQVVFQRICAIDGLDEIDKAADDIIITLVFVGNGQDVVFIGPECLIFAIIPVAAGIGQSFHIERITTKHTAYGIGNK